MPLSAGEQECAERSFKRNIFKRDQAMDQLTVLIGLVNTAQEPDAILDQLIDLGRDSEFTVTHEPIGNRAVEFYYSIKAKCNELGLNNKTHIPLVTASNVQLPKIQLPSFAGKILQWRSFRDTVVSLVHDNSQLSVIQKFHYLLLAVSCSAAAVIRSVPLSEANYPIVWQTLNDRFDNKRVLMNAHLYVLFRFSTIKTESLGELKHFLNTFQKNIAALRALDVDDLSAFLLFYIASRVLDPVTRQSFEFEYHATEIPKFDMLADFVQIRCQLLQNSTLSTKQSLNDGLKTHPKTKLSLFSASTSEPMICVLCKASHGLYNCPKFLQQNVKQRFRYAKYNRLCMNCLGTSHKTSECKSSYTCRRCASKHHSLLHLDKKKVTKNTFIPKGTINNIQQSTSNTSESERPEQLTCNTSLVGTSYSQTNVLLGTAIVRIRDNSGKLSPVRALIDTGSQISVITSTSVSRLGIKRRHCNISVAGLSQTPVSTTKGSIDCTLVPYNSLTPEIYCEPLILSRITGAMPNIPLTKKIRSTYAHLKFADPSFDIPGQIDFLLGADIYPHILGQSYQVLHTPDLPSAYETQLGWVILGQPRTKSCTPPVSLLLTPEQSIATFLGNRRASTEK